MGRNIWMQGYLIGIWRLSCEVGENRLPNPEFEQAIFEFLTPIISYLSDNEPTCQVYWVHPNEPEENHELSIPSHQIEQYLRSFLFEGFFAGVRVIKEEDNKQLQIVLWEEPDGEFKQVYWPALNGAIMGEWVWSGFSTNREKE